MYENFHLRRRSKTKRKHGYHYQKLYNDRRKAYGNCLATDNPYEVLEQAKNMNDIGCYF